MAINYGYDPLNRLTEANYSTGDYYHYTYDPVGNRLTQDTSVNGQPSTTNYGYDIANRLTSVDGVNYTFDNNGNLLSDGVNAYTYDSANRLIGFQAPQVNATFGYNGLGDRLQQTLNGQSINYALDINAGLTQVLSDGSNTYLYSVDRIAQMNSTNTEYFLGDALGSVRQLTDNNGTVILTKSYQPYGEELSSEGSGSTSYSFTGEMADPTGLLYLRARYYSGDTGRFLTRDTWDGNDEQPISYNLWAYANANPVLYSDPSGNCLPPPFPPDVEYADKNVNLPKSNWLNTYTAAGIAVQCWAATWQDWMGTNDYSGRGPAQISDKQKETPYGEWIEDPDHLGDKSYSRGYGLLCYIVSKFDPEVRESISCTVCKTKEEMDKEYGPGTYEQETPYNQTEIKWAVEYMRRRIKLVTDSCQAAGCSSTDIYIAAALAQNGPGFTVYDLNNWLTAKKNRINEKGVTLNWFRYFDFSQPKNTSEQLSRFKSATDGLKTWYIPRDVNFSTVRELIGR